MHNHHSTPLPEQEREAIVRATREWLLRAVIGLNLCPFAKAVHVKDRIRYVVSAAATLEGLCDDLCRELQYLHTTDAQTLETTLLVHPRLLQDFLEYNDFLDVADALIQDLELEGEIQIASFHPDYQFAGTSADAIENYTNRSPYPMLQLLRESSIEDAIEAYPDASNIYERNIETLRTLGFDGVSALNVFPRLNQARPQKRKKT
jgi:hypothetical protein